jgi:hypothetical protein
VLFSSAAQNRVHLHNAATPTWNMSSERVIVVLMIMKRTYMRTMAIMLAPGEVQGIHLPNALRCGKVHTPKLPLHNQLTGKLLAQDPTLGWVHAEEEGLQSRKRTR